MRRSAIILILFCVLLSQGPPVFACTGPYDPPFESIANYDLIVAATVTDVDDVGIGAIIKVDRYFKGQGGEYLVVMPYPPALQYAGHIRRYDTGCLYAARHANPWKKHDSGYLGLTAKGDGTFKRSPLYSPHDGSVEFYSDRKGDYGGYVRLPVDDFEWLLLIVSGKYRKTEPTSNPYPLMRFLNITTESGKRYRLNPDRSVTWLDPAIHPAAISNDGSHVMFQLDGGELGFQYLAMLKKPFDPMRHALGSAESGGGQALSDGYLSSYGWLHPAPGQSAQFSPNSDYVAVQEAARLVVYAFVAEPMYGAAVGFAHRMFVREIASFDVDWRRAGEKQPFVWSANSGAIAYQDSTGIWLWNRRTDEQPQRVVSNNEKQALLDLSYTGRYIRYGSRATWSLLDVQTGATWQDMLISPDESQLIQIQIALNQEEARGAGTVKRFEPCPAPLARCPLMIRAAAPHFIFWHDEGFLGLVSASTLLTIPWKSSTESACCDSQISSAELPHIIAFAYDSRYQQPAFAFEETKIGFGLREKDNYYDSIDLSETLDSPIVDIEWGQPVFYLRQ